MLTYFYAWILIIYTNIDRIFGIIYNDCDLYSSYQTLDTQKLCRIFQSIDLSNVNDWNVSAINYCGTTGIITITCNGNDITEIVVNQDYDIFNKQQNGGLNFSQNIWPSNIKKIELPRQYPDNGFDFTSLVGLVELEILNLEGFNNDRSHDVRVTITTTNWQYIKDLPKLKVFNIAFRNWDGIFDVSGFLGKLEELQFQTSSLNGNLDFDIFLTIKSSMIFIRGWTLGNDGRGNIVTGEIELEALTEIAAPNLREFRMFNNKFTGTITTTNSIPLTPTLKMFELQGNDLSGQINWSIFRKNSNLEKLTLFNNQFTGTIDWSIISYLFNNQLTLLRLEGNSFNDKKADLRNLTQCNDFRLDVSVQCDENIYCPTGYGYTSHNRNNSKIECDNSGLSACTCQCINGNDIITSPLCPTADTFSPSLPPTKEPTNSPTIPTTLPTINPSIPPTATPTNNPSLTPSVPPTMNTVSPTLLTNNPSVTPTFEPTTTPSITPTSLTAIPTSVTTYPSELPTYKTNAPTAPTMVTYTPSTSPTTQTPSEFPTESPTLYQAIVTDTGLSLQTQILLGITLAVLLICCFCGICVCVCVKCYYSNKTFHDDINYFANNVRSFVSGRPYESENPDANPGGTLQDTINDSFKNTRPPQINVNIPTDEANYVDSSGIHHIVPKTYEQNMDTLPVQPKINPNNMQNADPTPGAPGGINNSSENYKVQGMKHLSYYIDKNKTPSVNKSNDKRLSFSMRFKQKFARNSFVAKKQKMQLTSMSRHNSDEQKGNNIENNEGISNDPASLRQIDEINADIRPELQILSPKKIKNKKKKRGKHNIVNSNSNANFKFDSI